MKAHLWLLAALVVAVGACATSRYVGPTSGRSSDVQSVVSRALERALEAVPWQELAGRSVAVRAATLTERFGGRSPEEAYLEELALQRALAAGACRPQEGRDPDIELRVLGRALGANRTRRDFIPLYYAETVEGVADLKLTAFAVRGQDRTQLWSREATASAFRRSTYVLYIFGPQVTEEQR